MSCSSPSLDDVTDYEMIKATHAVLSLLSARWSVDVLG